MEDWSCDRLLKARTHVWFHPHAARRLCAAAKARRLGSPGSRGRIAPASPPLKLYLDGIFSVITGGRTNSPKAGGENLEFSIVFAASALRPYNNLSARCSRLFISLVLQLLGLYRLEVVTKKHRFFVWDTLVKPAAKLALAQKRSIQENEAAAVGFLSPLKLLKRNETLNSNPFEETDLKFGGFLSKSTESLLIPLAAQLCPGQSRMAAPFLPASCLHYWLNSYIKSRLRLEENVVFAMLPYYQSSPCWVAAV